MLLQYSVIIYMMDVAGTLYHCKLIAISGLWIGGCVGYLQKEHHMRFMVTIAMNFLGEINNAGKGAIKV